MRSPAFAFSAATLFPVPLLAAGALAGGTWVWAALATLTIVVFALDQLTQRARPAAPEGVEFPAAHTLSVLLALIHLALFPLAVAAVAGFTGLDPLTRAAVFVAFGLWFGHISNANAHELIHRPTRGLRRLGTLVFVTHLYGHHASAHPLVHHRFVATPDDPATARLGEGFWSYLARAWPGNFIAGYRAEIALRRRADPAADLWSTPYPAYIAGAAAVLALAGGLGGPAALAGALGLALYAQVQLFLSDYVQHYGLTRAPRPGGGYAPVTDAHSWNAPHPVSGKMMLHAPRHSDHHAHPLKPYPALSLPPDAPMLPYGLPAMATIALVPRLWRWLMDRRVRRLPRQDTAHAAA